MSKKTKDNQDDQDPIVSPLREAAISLNVMYQELRSAGFSRRDALELVSKVMIGSLGEAIEDERGFRDI